MFGEHFILHLFKSRCFVFKMQFKLPCGNEKIESSASKEITKTLLTIEVTYIILYIYYIMSITYSSYDDRNLILYDGKIIEYKWFTIGHEKGVSKIKDKLNLQHPLLCWQKSMKMPSLLL